MLKPFHRRHTCAIQLSALAQENRGLHCGTEQMASNVPEMFSHRFSPILAESSAQIVVHLFTSCTLCRPSRHARFLLTAAAGNCKTPEPIAHAGYVDRRRLSLTRAVRCCVIAVKLTIKHTQTHTHTRARAHAHTHTPQKGEGVQSGVS